MRKPSSNSEKPRVDFSCTKTPWKITVHPWKLTCPQKMDYFNLKYIFQPSFFRGYISFQGGNILEPQSHGGLLQLIFRISIFGRFFGGTRRSFSRVHFLFQNLCAIYSLTHSITAGFLFAHPIWKNNISSIWIISPIFRVKVKTALNNCHLDGSVSIVLKPQFSPLKVKLLHSTWKFWNFIGNLRSPASCDANFGPTNMTSEILVGGFNPFEKH